MTATFLLLPMGALGAWAYDKGGKGGHLDMRASLLIAVGLFFGAYVGARANQHLSSPQATRAFPMFLVFAATRMWMGAK